MRGAAYEALMEALKWVPEDCYNILIEGAKTVIARLEQTVAQVRRLCPPPIFRRSTQLVCFMWF